MINWFNANLKEAMSFLPLTGEIFLDKKCLKILVFTVFCDKSRLKRVILEQNIELTSKGYHMLS